jgi:hypothetical protein
MSCTHKCLQGADTAERHQLQPNVPIGLPNHGLPKGISMAVTCVQHEALVRERNEAQNPATFVRFHFLASLGLLARTCLLVRLQS